MARSKSQPRKSKKRPTPSPPPPPTWDEKAINALIPWRIELAGLALFLAAMIILLNLIALPEDGCPGIWLCLFRETVGWGAYPLLLSGAAAGIHVMLRQVERPYRISARQVIGLELLLLTALPVSHVLTGATLATAHQGRGGGLVGWALADPLLDFLGPFLTTILYLSLLAWGAGLIAGVSSSDVQRWLQQLSGQLLTISQQVAPAERPPAVPAIAPPREAAPPTPQPRPPDELIIIDDSTAGDLPGARRRRKLLPRLDMLDEGGAAALTKEEIDAKKRKIEQTLADFGLPAEVTQIRRGPAVTQFGVQPGYVEKPGPDGTPKQFKVRVGQIAALQKDLALALAVSRLRVQAPVPGQRVVGIEVPNAETTVVRLRPVIESGPFFKLKGPLAVGLGRNVSGAPVAVDLGKLPHLLIAGTTGAGKSVCINALISCLVFNNGPEQLNLIMIDPKKVELIRFNGLPHLIGKVETEADRAVGVLRWLTAEMDRRYELFAHVGARNLNGYNRKMARDKKKKVPYMAVFIDELADLMHTYPGDVERTLCRLAQMARATGIHLVVATQRPSTDVITGLIKANFPARLSFSVASGTDSRVILDSVGAEHLLGKGDMLFLGPEASAPQRIQGVFVSDLEVERIVKHWQDTLPDWEAIPCPWETLIAKHALLDETDSMLEQAIELVQKRDNISTSYLQRRMRIGFPRAARIMEHLYEMGLVEDPKTGGKTRKTYVEEEDDPLDNILADRD